jgi:hypothetical protein
MPREVVGCAPERAANLSNIRSVTEGSKTREESEHCAYDFRGNNVGGVQWVAAADQRARCSA